MDNSTIQETVCGCGKDEVVCDVLGCENEAVTFDSNALEFRCNEHSEVSGDDE